MLLHFSGIQPPPVYKLATQSINTESGSTINEFFVCNISVAALSMVALFSNRSVADHELINVVWWPETGLVAGMVGLPSKWVKLAPINQSGTFYRANKQKTDLNKSQIGPIWGQSDPI